MSVDENQKKAILDVISLLKSSFDIKDDDAVVIAQRFSDQEHALNDKLEVIKKREQELDHNTRLKLQQIKSDQNEIRKQQHDISQQFRDLKLKIDALTSQERSMNDRTNNLKQREQQLQGQKEQILQELEKVASLSRHEALNRLCSKLENEAKLKVDRRISEMLNEAQMTMQTKARDILAYTIQKETVDVITNLATSTVDLPDDSIKGKIIGREGRNIKSFEEITGVTVLIDDTPETIVLSCYDPARREIARLAMVRLIADGRIHPRRIEEIVELATNEFNEEVVRIGQEMITKHDVPDVHPELIKTLGKLKYRSSYSQNVLAHSEEVALIAADIASELGFNKKLLLRAGLFHDIGKVLDRNEAGSHAELGAEFARRYNESDQICRLIAEHHDNEPASVQTWIIKTADTISSARPGARQDSFDAYIKRLQDLERIATSFAGIKAAYAMMAGRELRVIVEPDSISDAQIEIIADNITNKIQGTMTYPGQIKVIVIREKRQVRYA